MQNPVLATVETSVRPSVRHTQNDAARITKSSPTNSPIALVQYVEKKVNFGPQTKKI